MLKLIITVVDLNKVLSIRCLNAVCEMYLMFSFLSVGGPTVTLREDVPAVVALHMAENRHRHPRSRSFQLWSGH